MRSSVAELVSSAKLKRLLMSASQYRLTEYRSSKDHIVQFRHLNKECEKFILIPSER